MERHAGPNFERNIESDRHAFLESIAATKIDEIATDFDEVAIDNLRESVANNKIFILGEMHGVKENVDVIYTLFKKFGFRQLALEWEPELEKVVDRFLETGELDFTAIQNSPDGRITAGHFALLKKLKSEGMLDNLVCFDGGSGRESWNARDAAMAQNIHAHLSDSPMLVVAGNMHTKTSAIHLDDELELAHPMGEQIKKKIPTVASGKVEYLSGQYHNFGTQEFNETPTEELSGYARFYLNEEGLYVYKVIKAHAAIVPNPNRRL